MTSSELQQRNQLIEEGFCIVPNVLDASSLAELREITDRMVDAMSEEEARRQRSTGSLISVMNDHRLVKLICNATALRAVEAMGFHDIRFQSGYVISKPPKSPRLFWHFDWGFWKHPLSYQKFPAQLFFMYYLTDTSRRNGCLRVIPGSHIHENPLHAQLAHAHTAALSEAKDLTRIEFQDRPDEVDVSVKAGDLVIGDSRILHAAHANESDQRRTVITLWFHPNYNELPQDLQAAFVRRCDPVPANWPDAAKEGYESIVIRCDEGVEPTEFSRARDPEAVGS